MTGVVLKHLLFKFFRGRTQLQKTPNIFFSWQDLESNLNRSNEEKAYLEESIQTLQKDVETAGDVKYNLESDLESKKEEILRVKNDMIQALESEIGKTQQVVEDLQSDLEKLSQQKINMELEMTQRIEQKELEFSTEVEKLRAEKEDVEQEVEAKLKEIERMKEDHEEKIKEVESRNAQVSENFLLVRVVGGGSFSPNAFLELSPRSPEHMKKIYIFADAPSVD